MSAIGIKKQEKEREEVEEMKEIFEQYGSVMKCNYSGGGNQCIGSDYCHSSGNGWSSGKCL
jgi:hypothetical protein